MLTVKLRHETVGRLRIVECESVSASTLSPDLTVLTTHFMGGLTQVFQIIKRNSARDAGEPDECHYHVAFVENSKGATTQIIRGGLV
jgi:hypothetical protein